MLHCAPELGHCAVGGAGPGCEVGSHIGEQRRCDGGGAEVGAGDEMEHNLCVCVFGCSVAGGGGGELKILTPLVKSCSIFG